MKPKGTKLEPKLKLNMSFEEALARFTQADPKEVEECIRKSRKKKPPGSKKKPSGGSDALSQNVVRLRDRRKPNYGS
jgi:hypothetical protein